MTVTTQPVVEYQPQYRLALFSGPGGFTQAPMSELQARAIATAFGIDFIRREATL